MLIIAYRAVCFFHFGLVQQLLGVAFGDCAAEDCHVRLSHRAQARVLPALQRVLGIACGVILLEITAILVFPRSATQVAVEKMGSALQKLAALNQMTWIQGPWQAPQADAAGAPAKGSRSACSAGLSAAPMHPTAV